MIKEENNTSKKQIFYQIVLIEFLKIKKKKQTNLLSLGENTL